MSNEQQNDGNVKQSDGYVNSSNVNDGTSKNDVSLDQLTLIRCTPQQIEQTLRNHWVKWGEPRGFPLDRYLARGERLRNNRSFSKDGAHLTWALVDRREPGVLLAHCET